MLKKMNNGSILSMRKSALVFRQSKPTIKGKVSHIKRLASNGSPKNRHLQTKQIQQTINKR